MDARPSNLRLLFVIDNLSTGGAQRQMVNLAIGMRSRGHLVDLFCYAPGDLLAKPLYEAGIPVHRHFKRSRYSVGVIFALRKIIETTRCDLVLSFLSTPNVYALVAGQLLARRRVPVVVSERFCDLEDNVDLRERLVRMLYRYAAHIVVNSHHQRLNLATKYPSLRDRLTTIYNGYDLQVFRPPPVEPADETLKLLTIASVSPYKNGLCLVEALKMLKQEHCALFYVDWIGQRVLAGARLRYLREMEDKIHSYGLEHCWHWLDQRSDIVEQLHQHDVLVHPSYGEGLPNVVCEALACARPVIVSDTLDHGNLVQHNRSGYLFDWQDPADLAEKIKTFACLSPEERRQMGQHGRRFAEENLSLSRFTDEYERLFADVLRR